MNYFNLKPWIKQYLINKKFNDWTPIQLEFLKEIKSNKNLIGISPTGSGKTLSFLLPILNKIDFSKKKYQAIIVCPTRELARQIEGIINEIKPYNNELRTALWIGGLDLDKLIKQAQLNNNPQIIVCTPKRFLEVSQNLPDSKFENLIAFGLDEADMLLDLNFMKEIKQISNKLDLEKKDVWKFATSATLHNLLNNELQQIYKNIKVIDLNNNDVIYNKIKHYLLKTQDKNHALSVLLQKINPYFCIIFVNTTKKADEIYKMLLQQNYQVINLHAGLKTRERKNNYKEIKRLNYQYVVASDLVSRGLDIDGASHVISYDMPQNSQWYIHRAGRTGRSKYIGESYILYNPNEFETLNKLSGLKLNLINCQIKNNQLVDANIKISRKKISSTEQDLEIKKTINISSKKVKPGYKKKLKEKIKKIEQKYKRRHIEKLVKEQRKKEYYSKKSF